MRQWSITSLTGRLILTTTILASGFVFLFGAAISVALPAIQADLDAPLSGIQWIVNAYSLVLGVFILLSGALSDVYGRKRIFLLGSSLFIVGLVASGFANTFLLLIGFQIILGVGAGMMVPVSLVIIHACFYERELGRAIGLWTGLSAVFAALGPFVGGLIVDLLGWEALFFLLTPLTLIVMFMVWRFVPSAETSSPRTVDIWGSITLGLGLFGVLFALIQAPVLGWMHGAILGGILMSVLSFSVFFVVEKRAKNPIIPLSIFEKRDVLGANIATLLLYFVLGGTLFFLTLNFQQVQGMSATWTGVALLPPIGLIALFSGMSGALVDKFGSRIPMIGGPLLVALGTSTMFFAGTDANYFLHFLPGLILIGVGMVIVIPALTVSALAVADKYTGAASGVNNAASRTSWLFAVALLGVVAQFAFVAELQEGLQDVTLPPALETHIWEERDHFGGIEIPEEFSIAEQEQATDIIHSSFVYGFRWVLAVNALFALLASIVSFCTIRRRRSSS